MYLLRLKGLEGSSGEELYTWSRRWLDAELDLAANKDERVAAHQRQLDRMKDWEKQAEAMAAAGQGRQSDASAAAYYRTQVELLLTQAQGRKAASMQQHGRSSRPRSRARGVLRRP